MSGHRYLLQRAIAVDKKRLLASTEKIRRLFQTYQIRTFFPLLLVPGTIARSVLGPLMLMLLVLAASKHMLEELELGLCERGQEKKSPQGFYEVQCHRSRKCKGNRRG